MKKTLITMNFPWQRNCYLINLNMEILKLNQKAVELIHFVIKFLLIQISMLKIKLEKNYMFKKLLK